MSSQQPINDPSAHNKSLLVADGETDSETRRLHARTRGSVNALVMEPVDSTGTAYSPTTRYNGDTSGGTTEPLAGVVIRSRQSGGSVDFGTKTAPIFVSDAPIPSGATQITAASGNRANAIATASLSGAVSKTTYITGFEITASGSTAALVVNPTLSDGTWTLTYVFVFPAGVAVAATPLIVQFSRPLAASAVNTAITLTLPAGGAGNTNAAIVAHGYQY